MNLIDRVVALWTRQHPEEPVEELQATASRLSRRRFLQILGATSAVVAINPALPALEFWTPSPMVVVPDMGGLLITADLVTREALRILTRNLTFTNAINRTYDGRYESVVRMNAMGDFPAPNFGTDTVHDWNTRIRAEFEESVKMVDAPLPIDAFVNQVVLATEGEAKAYGVVNHGRMTIKRVA